MAQSVGEVALDIVAGKNTVNSVVSGAMNDVQNTVNKGSSGISNALGKIGGVAKTVGKVTAVGLGVASTAVVALGKQSIDAYANYEQLVGGVETLFGESSDIVIGYADRAYKTAGMSANDYMETVTGFSASLLQSLGGDTVKASEYADRAITDMADNANKMGTDMQMIQNAYQGFAKQNYTMLDNLKLGYGGTQEEMKRLIADASQMTDEMSALGVSVDATDMSFGNIVNAISVVQKHLDITGTTAKEAEGTISGSLASVSASWTNLLTGMTSDTADFDSLIDEFVDSLVIAGDNLIPRISKVLDGVANLVTQLAPKIIAVLPDMLSTLLPAVVNGAVDLVNAVVGAIPQLVGLILDTLPQFIDGVQSIFEGIVTALPSLMETICSALPTLIPMLVDASVSVIVTLLKSLPLIIQPLIDYLPNILISIVDAVTSNLPLLIEGLVTLVMGIVNAIPQIISALVDALPDVISSIISGLLACLPQLLSGIMMLTVGILAYTPIITVELIKMIPQIIVGLVNGIIDGIPMIVNGFVELFSGVGTESDTIVTPFVETIAGFFFESFEKIKNVVSGALSFVNDNVVSVWNGIVSFLSPVLNSIKSVVSGTIDNVKNSVSNGFNIVKNTVSSVFDGIMNKISSVMDGAKNIVSSAIEKIKGFFHFDWSLPKIKLPHFSIDGEFSLNPPSIPTFGIDWYAKAMDKGMILNTPTIFGASGGNLLGAGEAGSETVVGTNSLMNMIHSAVAGSMASIRMAVEAPALTNVRAGSNTAMQDDSKIDRLIELMEKLISKDDSDMTVPIYIGNELIDEYILNRNSRQTIRSGGYA